VPKINKIIVSKFYKDIFILFKGTVIAQIIAFLASIFLAKLYGANAFGLFGVFVSTASVFAIINTLQLDNFIILSKKKTDSKNWTRFLLILTPFISVLLSFLLFLSLPFLTNQKINETTVLLSGFAAILLSYNKISEAFLTFNKDFIPISFAKIIFVIANISMQYVLFFYYQNTGLIYGFIVALLSVCIYYFIKNSNVFGNYQFKKIKKDIHKNTSILTYLLPSNIINSMALHAMPILILAFFSDKEAGVYFFSLKILAAPLFLISSSVSQVFYQKSEDLHQTDNTLLYHLSKKVIKTNVLLMLFFIVIINTIGIKILEIYLDKGWEQLKIFTFLLSFLVLARASFNPISSLIIVLHKNHIGLIFNVYLLLINLIAIYVGYQFSDIIYTIIILTIFGGVGYLVLLTYFLRHLKKIQDV